LNNEELLKRYNQAALLYHQKKIFRFARRPFKFIAWKILELFASWSGQAVKIGTQSFWGENMKIVFPELVSMYIFKYGFYEEGLTRIFLESIRPNMILLDIGAHFGYYSLLGAFLVGDQGKVHAFEPTLTSFNILKENTLGRKNIRINNIGVSNINKKIDFYDYGTMYSAFNSLYNPRIDKKVKSVKYVIDCVSIDSYVESENIIPNFIKIDAESSEYDIILGMEKTIRSCKPMITIEVGDMDVEGISRNIDIINTILSYGYQAFECQNGKLIKHEINNNSYLYNNLLFCSY
jgi:FkbM family methyltransferase